MNVVVVGTGYVGLVLGTCLASKGNIVWCIDNDLKKLGNLSNANIPIYEPGLSKMVKDNMNNKRLFFSDKLQDALNLCDVCFIAVGTPIGEDGSAELKYVKEVAQNIGKFLTKDICIAVKSTVPVGTNDIVKQLIENNLKARNINVGLTMISNPEFLREGMAVNDTIHPDRIIVGSDSEKGVSIMKELYSSFISDEDEIICMDIRSAEMAKYASNALLATKISFINEIANICEKVGANIINVKAGMIKDKRIGKYFLDAGCGFGGSCFPKDLLALSCIGEECGSKTDIINAVMDVNERQKLSLVSKIINYYGEDLSKLVFAIWGLSFKPNTDDMREAPSITIIKELLKRGAKIKVYDPKAEEQAKSYYLAGLKDIEYCNDKYDCVTNADAMVLVTEWEEFKDINFDKMSNMKQKVIFDGRNIYDIDELNKNKYEYYQIGVGM